LSWPLPLARGPKIPRATGAEGWEAEDSRHRILHRTLGAPRLTGSWPSEATERPPAPPGPSTRTPRAALGEEISASMSDHRPTRGKGRSRGGSPAPTGPSRKDEEYFRQMKDPRVAPFSPTVPLEPERQHRRQHVPPACSTLPARTTSCAGPRRPGRRLDLVSARPQCSRKMAGMGETVTLYPRCGEAAGRAHRMLNRHQPPVPGTSS